MNVMQRLTAYVSGKVQKTGYRARVVTIAQNLRLKGYVQNLEDGRVKVVAEGETIDLEILLRALDIKNTLIHVVDIKIEYSSATGDFEGFFKVVSGGGETDQRLDVAAEKLTELIVVNKDILIELKATREELKSEIKATRYELKETREDIRESSEAIVGEIGELRSDMKETLGERLMRIESDVSQIKAKVGL
ncbi:MAG: acylphosphatase [Methanothrix sp.]|nr:acylphosphatase [Methanothrix sp.]